MSDDDGHGYDQDYDELEFPYPEYYHDENSHANLSYEFSRPLPRAAQSPGLRRMAARHGSCRSPSLRSGSTVGIWVALEDQMVYSSTEAGLWDTPLGIIDKCVRFLAERGLVKGGGRLIGKHGKPVGHLPPTIWLRLVPPAQTPDFFGQPAFLRVGANPHSV